MQLLELLPVSAPVRVTAWQRLWDALLRTPEIEAESREDNIADQGADQP